MSADARATIRLDKWLWHARFFKTRSLATKTVADGRVRVDGTPVSKPARAVGAGDVLTFTKEDDVRVIRILDTGTRRGPATEARALYDDLAPPAPKTRNIRSENPAFDGKGRPSRRDRQNRQSQMRDAGLSPLEDHDGLD